MPEEYIWEIDRMLLQTVFWFLVEDADRLWVPLFIHLLLQPKPCINARYWPHPKKCATQANFWYNSGKTLI